MKFFGFFGFKRKRCFLVPTPLDLCGAEWEGLLKFVHIVVGFAMSVFLVTLPTLWYRLKGVQVGILQQHTPTGIQREIFCSL